MKIRGFFLLMKDQASQKIVLLNYEYPPLGGGGGHASQIIAEGLAKKGHEVLVLTSSFKNLPCSEVQNGVLIRRVPTLRAFQEKCRIHEMLCFILSAILIGSFHVFRFRPQSVLCFFSIPCGPVALFWKLLFRVPYVVALRGGDVPGFLPEQLSRFHELTNWLTRIIWNQAKVVTANSFGLASLAKQFYGHGEFPVVPNGVHPHCYYQRPQSESHAKLSLLTVGRLSQQKKIDRIISALGRFVQNHGHLVHLNIVGDGPLRRELEQQVKDLDLEDVVTFHGWVNRDQIMSYYQKSDVFVLASDFEGMPNVMLEAMASSMALVAVKAPGVEELIDPSVNGYLVSKDHLQGFEKHWASLVQDTSALSRMQEASYKKALEMSWDHVVDGFESLVL